MRKNTILLTLTLVLLYLVSACGENSGSTQSATSTSKDSEKCIGCHAKAVSAVTGMTISEEWKVSRHNTDVSGKTMGAGCRDCHEPEAGHPGSCGRCHGGTPSASNVTGLDVTANPDTEKKCLKCHHSGTLGAPHFNNVTSGKYPASWVSSEYVGNCRKCHNPHDPTSSISANREWADSGHGDTTALPWTNYDFKARGTAKASPANSVAADCVRCHTTTGYVNYVTSNFTDIHAWQTTAASKTLGKEVLACNACHDDGKGNAYGFKPRKVARVTGYYNYSSPSTGKLLVAVPFPDAGHSNICMVCHTGKEGGLTIKEIERVESASGSFKIFSSASGMAFINSHYLTAGATVFKAAGYEYPGRDYNNVSYFKHDKVGIDNTNGTGTNGPCVGCHMSSPQKHTFMPVKRNESTDTVTEITSPVCAKCHTGQHALSAAFLHEEKEAFNASLAALASALKARGFTFSGAHPYFGNKNWQTNKGTKGGYGPGTGGRTMGAAFNFNLLRHDYGAFAHNSIYTRRLIYDSIDWIDDGVLNKSVAASLADPAMVPLDPALEYNSDRSKINFDTAMRDKALAYLKGTR